jgi:solute carrier family 8 (sodium/calcium exchanger)
MSVSNLAVAAFLLHSAAADDGPSICEEDGRGLVFPLFGSEYSWPQAVQALAYFCGLIYLFFGVSIIADVFMSAIEVITSRTREVMLNGVKVQYSVWNATVANLTLMALGSSAPEILLSVIEIFSGDFFSGALGPSTIVGSAAINLFGISAVCMVALPDGEGRTIKETGVFLVTASASVFAYVWLLAILQWSSPNVVTITEGVLTFM